MKITKVLTINLYIAMTKNDLNNSVKQLKSAIQENSAELIALVNSSTNPEDVAVKMLTERLGLSADYAAIAAQRFMSGFEAYDLHRKASIKNVEEALLVQLNGYSEAEKREFLTAVLLSLEGVDSKTESLGLKSEEIEMRKKFYSNFTIECLSSMIVEKSKDISLTNKVMELIEQMPLPQNIDNISDAVAKRRGHFSYAVASLLYIEMRNGNVLFKGECCPTNFQLGAIAAGAMELMELQVNFASGKMDKSMWRASAEAIMSALFVLAVGAVITLAIAGAVTFIMHAVTLIFGTSVLACAFGYYFLCCPLIVVAVCGAIMKMEDFTDLVNETIEECFNAIVEFFSKTKIIKTLNKSCDCETLPQMEESSAKNYEDDDIADMDAVNPVSC